MRNSPYQSTPIFDEHSLPDKLRSAHNTKARVWGIIWVLEGRIRYVIEETAEETILTPERPGLVQPEQLHRVEPLGPMKMQVEFYDHSPQILEK